MDEQRSVTGISSRALCIQKTPAMSGVFCNEALYLVSPEITSRLYSCSRTGSRCLCPL